MLIREKSMIKFPLIIIPIASLFVGCEKQAQTQISPGVNQRLQNLETEIANFKSNQVAVQNFNALQWRCDTNYEQRLDSLETAEAQGNVKWALLDPTTKSYQRIDTSLGSLLISVKSVQPYLDGYKVTLLIGNPYAMDFNGFGVSCKWSASYVYTNGVVANVDEVQKSEKSKNLEQIEVLRSGCWNSVELTISPATADEMKMLRISLNPSIVSLLKKPELQP
jgi:hypothetical protein